MTAASPQKKVLVMGVGNTLMQDDGIGVHVAHSFKSELSSKNRLTVLDGGTIGLSLLPEIEDADAVIVIDASEIGERPGAMRIFRNREIDRQLSRRKRTVHEVALADLFSAAAIRGRCPPERALIAIQPASTEMGLEPTPDVRAAIPRACSAINKLSRVWLGD
jgi:hydrogenase maturation protease